MLLANIAAIYLHTSVGILVAPGEAQLYQTQTATGA
jgi:hypothetical protein